MSVNAKRYRPPFLTQRGIDSTLNDCRVVATLHGVAAASSGEAVTRPDGKEMSQPTLRRLARKMLKAIDKLNAPGGLNTADARAIIASVWPQYPAPTVVDIGFDDMVKELRDGTASFSVSGNPAKIKGASPVKRTAVPHEFYVDRVRGERALVYDGMRQSGKEARGEWVPLSDLRQFAFKSDGAVVGTVRFPRGGWTRAALAVKTLRGEVQRMSQTIKNKNATIKTVRASLADAIDEIAVLQADIDGGAGQAARDELLDGLRAWIEEQTL